MGDDFDGCECFYELNMRRLLNYIRQSQGYCTDTECIDLPSGNERSQNSESVDFTTVTLMMMFAVILYVMRPSRTREIKNSNDFSHDHNSDNGPPPAPPSVN